MSLQIGDAAPDFTLPDQNGDPISLASLRGKKVVLYFYPKDDTPGCTKEACNFRDRWEQLKANNITVLGISKDGATSHNKFINKHDLPFTLLTDEEPCAQGSSSVSRVKGRSCLLMNLLWEVAPSLLMPRTVMLLAFSCSQRSRKLQASLVQPGVSSLG